MNNHLIQLFETEVALNRLVTRLPHAFEIVKQEMPTGNPAIGVLREHVIVGFFLSEFGQANVSVPDKGIERGFDVQLFGHELSIKTATKYTNPKILWTVDPLRVGVEMSRDYRPSCDMFFVNIFWGKRKEGIFYIPVEAQYEVSASMGDDYLKARVGTNHRGIEITSAAMTSLKAHKLTRVAVVDWIESGLTTSPLTRWERFWREE